MCSQEQMSQRHITGLLKMDAILYERFIISENVIRRKIWLKSV